MDDRIDRFEEDWLRRQFEPQGVADDGFSRQVIRRVRRQLWRRRLLIALAFAIGALIAAAPAGQLLGEVGALIPADIAAGEVWLKSNSSVVLAAMLALASIGFVSLMEE